MKISAMLFFYLLQYFPLLFVYPKRFAFSLFFFIFLFFSESLRDQVRARKLKPNGGRGDGRTSGGRTWGMQVANPHKCRSGRRSRLSFAATVKLRMPLEGGCTTTPVDRWRQGRV
ncbi:hypothetical protein CPAR01_10770 [Colletotrichum paranaense]|uniref:Secreted protein n=1 Tax=Colletotrichum paranaense TaxID=1914294 RepID=A0ABQ9S9Q8_9PEZI|nr:uncharacterized protein CPAR01_10770 [Colletotrichum paranaense]KAK1531121.1 hypothetical protein CPAR01_10770 [Colletotrichum paranaense]